MTADAYLRSLLVKYQVDAKAGLAIAKHDILPVLQAWRGGDLRDVRLSGSIAKGTANSSATDMDLFIELHSSSQGTLQAIYNSLFHVARQCWTARAQNVSIGVQCSGYHFDLVPGRQQAGYQNWYSLWRSKAQTWTQTNVDLHVQTVTQSGRAEEIRIVKLWRTLAGLDFSSFVLELGVIEALKGRRHGDLARNVSAALEWIRDNIETARLVDPANTNNVVSDDMTAADKRAAAVAAGRARSCTHFSDFVW